MKVTISYLQSEEYCAGVIERFVCKILRNVKVRRPRRHEPYRHIYISDVQGGGRTRKDPNSDVENRMVGAENAQVNGS